MKSFLQQLFTPFPRLYALLDTPLVLDAYKIAFTHPSYDDKINYQVYEQLGDLTINKFLVWYFYARFPHLQHPGGVKIVARLRINYGSKAFLAQLARELGFRSYILTGPGVPLTDSIYEDIFEAFIGVTETCMDTAYSLGMGWAECFMFLKSLMDTREIPLDYESLFDAKTRLKELCDKYKHFGKLTFSKKSNSCFAHIDSMGYIGSGRNEQEAAQCALRFLAQTGSTPALGHNVA